MIHIIGLGQNAGDLSIDGQKIISSCNFVIVKTAFTPTYKYFKDNRIKHVTCDDLFKKSKSFKELDDRIYKFLKLKEKLFKDIAYCVDGNASDDENVKYIYQNNVSVRIYEPTPKDAS